MNEYMMTMVCRALINLAGDLALEVNKDVDAIIDEALLDASVQIQCFGTEQVKHSVRKHNQYLHDKAFSQNFGVKQL